MNDILLLGDPRLYEKCDPVALDELDQLPTWIDLLTNALRGYRESYGVGRAIAAPQLGIMRRLIVMLYEGAIVALVNPSLHFETDEKILVWDDCMCMPGLYVQVERAKRIRIDFIDADLNPRFFEFEDDYAELLQHEYDHLDGILMTQRAIDAKAFRFKILR